MTEMLSERDQLITGIAQIIDHPTVYMGGPSRNALRIAKVVVDEFGAQLDAHPAPDTQAPERIDTSRENIERIYWLVAESKAGREVRTEALRLITALSAERDLASAQTAAAWIAGYSDGWRDREENNAWQCDGPPADLQAALDALIAERVREAFIGMAAEIEDEEREAASWGGPDPRGINAAQVNLGFAQKLRARASKEGR